MFRNQPGRTAGTATATARHIALPRPRATPRSSGPAAPLVCGVRGIGGAGDSGMRSAPPRHSRRPAVIKRVRALRAPTPRTNVCNPSGRSAALAAPARAGPIWAGRICAVSWIDGASHLAQASAVHASPDTQPARPPRQGARRGHRARRDRVPHGRPPHLGEVSEGSRRPNLSAPAPCGGAVLHRVVHRRPSNEARGQPGTLIARSGSLPASERDPSGGGAVCDQPRRAGSVWRPRQGRSQRGPCLERCIRALRARTCRAHACLRSARERQIVARIGLRRTHRGGCGPGTNFPFVSASGSYATGEAAGSAWDRGSRPRRGHVWHPGGNGSAWMPASRTQILPATNLANWASRLDRHETPRAPGRSSAREEACRHCRGRGGVRRPQRLVDRLSGVRAGRTRVRCQGRTSGRRRTRSRCAR